MSELREELEALLPALDHEYRYLVRMEDALDALEAVAALVPDVVLSDVHSVGGWSTDTERRARIIEAVREKLEGR